MTEAEKLQALAAKHAAGERLTNADGVLGIETRSDSLVHSSAYMEAQLRGYEEKEEGRLGKDECTWIQGPAHHSSLSSWLTL